MAKPRHRFSGPELGDLLDEVVAEHGETAAIAAVNRVRSGGVAGFFCREEFEVIVTDGDEGDRDGSGEERSVEASGPSTSPAPDADDDDGELIADLVAGPTGEEGAASAGLAGEGDAIAPAPAPTPASAPTRTPTPASASTGSDLAAGAGEDRIPARLAYRFDDDTPDEPVFGGPVAPGADRDRFRDLLERRLDETSATEADLSLRRLRATGPSTGRPAAESESQPVAPAPAPAVAPPPPAVPASTPAAPSPSGPPAAADRSAVPAPDLPAFWSGLDATASDLESFVPEGAPVVAVVGPLPLATGVARRLLDGPDLGSAEVFVLTDRAGIVSEPSWRLVRTANRLVHLVDRRLSGRRDDGGVPPGTGTEAPPGTGAETPPGTGAEAPPDHDVDAVGPEPPPTILVLDAPTDLPPWLVALQHRLRSAGVGLFRYAVAGQPTGADLERFRQGTDVPAVVDLVSRVEPARVVELVERRHPIVSVAGVDLGPELLRAFRRHTESDRSATGRGGLSGG